ncbi:potassium-transporting ATPase subunit F [Rikenella microfusus]
MRRLVRQNLKNTPDMFTTLFLVGIAVFVYLMYVLIKPEKF